MLSIFLQIDEPQPQYLQQIIVGFRPENLFFVEITSVMQEIGSFWTEELFFADQYFLAFFVLSLTLSVAVCH